MTPTGFLTVDYDPTLISPKTMALELQMIGLSVACGVRVQVRGMQCHSCVQSIQDLLGSLNGVFRAQVSLQDAAALVLHHPLVITQQELRDQIQEMGFSAMVLSDNPPGLELDLWQDLLWPTQVP